MININKEEILEYLEQSLILGLYRKEPVTQFHYDLNNSIINHFNDGFNPDHFEVVKPKPFLIENANMGNLDELYKNIISKICSKFSLNLVENPKQDYLVKENDYLLISHQYEHVPSDFNNNLQSKIEFLSKATNHSKSLTTPFDNSVGGLILFLNIENAPYIQNSLKALFKSDKYFSKSTENISFGVSTDTNFDFIKNKIQPALLETIMPIHINNMELSNKANNDKKLKFG